MTRFQITRADGRSDSDALMDAVKDQPYETVINYGALADALMVGAGRVYDAKDVQSIAARSRRRLLREYRRALRNVRGVGYKVAHPREQTEMASARERRANREMDTAVSLVRDIDHNALTTVERQLVTSHLVVVQTVRHAMSALRKRQDTQEQMIRKIASAVGVSLDPLPDVDVIAEART